MESSADVDVNPVDQDPPVPQMILGLFEEESVEPDMPAREAPEGTETVEAHEEDAIPFLNSFLAFRVIYGDGLRRMPSSPDEKITVPSHQTRCLPQDQDDCRFEGARAAKSGLGSLHGEPTPTQSHVHSSSRFVSQSLQYSRHAFCLCLSRMSATFSLSHCVSLARRPTPMTT